MTYPFILACLPNGVRAFVSRDLWYAEVTKEWATVAAPANTSIWKIKDKCNHKNSMTMNLNWITSKFLLSEIVFQIWNSINKNIANAEMAYSLQRRGSRSIWQNTVTTRGCRSQEFRARRGYHTLHQYIPAQGHPLVIRCQLCCNRQGCWASVKLA